MLTEEEQRWAKMIVLYPRRFGRLAGAMCTLIGRVGHLLTPAEREYYLALARGIDTQPLSCHNSGQANGESQLHQVHNVTTAVPPQHKEDSNAS